MEEYFDLPMRRNLYERKTAAVYVGALRYGPFQSVLDVLCHRMPSGFFFRRRVVLSARHSSYGIRVFQDVLQECEQALSGKPMVPEERDESPQLLPEMEERFAFKKRAGTEKELPYL